MVHGIPQQTESKYASIRGWGCLMMVYVWFISLRFGRPFTMSEIEDLWTRAIALGIILDNSLPTDGSEGEWYRCFIADASGWLHLVAEAIGEKVEPVLRYKAPRKLEPSDFYVFENFAYFGKPTIHFTGSTPSEDYNPDERIKLIRVKSVRGWMLDKEG
jgi:hypothetical protein